MFIGHLAAGYIATSLLMAAPFIPPHTRRFYMTVGLVSSVLPDIDMLQFYLVDQQQYHHHSYVTHIPFFWAMFLSGTALVGWWSQRRTLIHIVLIAGVNLLLHLALDSIVGRIHWFAPFSMRGITLVEVTDRYDPWYLNFVLHWTFLLEGIVITVAFLMYLHRRKERHVVR